MNKVRRKSETLITRSFITFTGHEILWMTIRFTVYIALMNEILVGYIFQ
jgi:hypothetical protein